MCVFKVKQCKCFKGQAVLDLAVTLYSNPQIKEHTVSQFFFPCLLFLKFLTNMHADLTNIRDICFSFGMVDASIIAILQPY